MSKTALSKDQIRQMAESDPRVFARLVNPTRVYGACHDDAFSWLSRPEAKDSQLILYPRAHQKSHIIAVWCAWWITKHPDTTILYVSATEDLAISQLHAIKQILESDIYRKYWPEMLNDDEFKRGEWSARNIKVDHPFRIEMGVRDRTVAARSIGSNTTGLHCDVLVFDDIVVPDNAYSQIGRDSVAASYSQFQSVLNPGGITKAVGTRYHPNDIYRSMKEAKLEVFSDEGEIIGEQDVYEVKEAAVHDEDLNFLWPREKHLVTGRYYGFDVKTLAKIRAGYLSVGERTQYYAQYFNDPNDPASERVSLDKFQYYDRAKLINEGGEWRYGGKPLSIYAGADLAFTTGERSDWSAFAVVGLNADGYIFLLDLIQFKTNKYERYYTTIERLWDKWGFRKMRVESNAGANVIVEYIKDRIREEGRTIVVEGKPARNEKNERYAAMLEPRYENNTIWHYKGGHMNEYEEQVVLARPAHDDLKDAVCIAIEISKVPRQFRGSETRGKILTHQRFGGRIRA